MDGEIVTPLVVLSLFPMVRYMINRNAANTNINDQHTQNEVNGEISLSNEPKANQEVAASCSFDKNEVKEEINLTSEPETNKEVVVRQARSGHDEDGREHNTRSDQTNHTTYIGKSKGNTLVGANINNHSDGGDVYGVYNDNRTINYNNFRDEEQFLRIRRNLKMHLNSIYLRMFRNRLYPFESDEEFSYLLDEIYIKPNIQKTPISTVVDSNGLRILLVGKYGMGKKTWLKYMALSFASGNENNEFFDTNNYEILVLCDVTKMIEELKSKKSFEDVLITYIHKNIPNLEKFKKAKQFLSQNSQLVLLIITGYEFIQDEEIKMKIKLFFERGGLENTTVFKSACIVFLYPEYGEKTSQMFLDNFNSKLTMEGVPKEEYRNVLKRTFEIDDVTADEFENRLEDLGLKFLKHISPRMFVISYHIYKQHKVQTAMEFLSKLIRFEVVEYLIKCKLIRNSKDLEPEVNSIFFQIGQHLCLRTYQDKMFEDKDFDKLALRVVRDLGLLTKDGKVFRFSHALIHEFFVNLTIFKAIEN